MAKENNSSTLTVTEYKQLAKSRLSDKEVLYEQLINKFLKHTNILFHLEKGCPFAFKKDRKPESNHGNTSGDKQKTRPPPTVAGKQQCNLSWIEE